MKPYTHRENIYHADRVVGIVAQFGTGDWRLSAVPGSPQYPSREDAVRAAIEEAATPAPTPTTPQPPASPVGKTALFFPHNPEQSVLILFSGKSFSRS